MRVVPCGKPSGGPLRDGSCANSKNCGYADRRPGAALLKQDPDGEVG